MTDLAFTAKRRAILERLRGDYTFNADAYRDQGFTDVADDQSSRADAIASALAEIGRLREAAIPVLRALDLEAENVDPKLRRWVPGRKLRDDLRQALEGEP